MVLSKTKMRSKILKGPTTQYMAEMGFGEYFWQATEKFGDRICQIDAYTHQKESFNTVRQRALRIAIQLKKMGVQPKDTIVTICPNNLDNVVPPLAALFLGAYACSIEPLMDLFDVKYLLSQITPKVIFTTETILSMVEEEARAMINKPQICVIGKSAVHPEMYEMEKMETNEEKYFKPVKVDVSETAFIVFSSGTTSMPKGIYMSHLGAMSVACHHDLNQMPVIDEPAIQFTTLYWISGIWTVAMGLIFGQPRIVGPNISALKFLELVDTYKIPHSFVFGRVLYDLINMNKKILNTYNTSSLKALFMGGSYTDAELILQLRKMFPLALVFQVYGATEIGTSPTDWQGADKNIHEDKISSVGKPGWNMEMKIVDVETREPLGPNQEGELLIKSPYRMNGYCHKDCSESFDKEGFLKTSDLAYYDEDDYIYIVGRLNDVFKYRGYKIVPSSIERVLIKHPAVEEAVVFGIRHPADYHHPAAYIVLKENSLATEQDIYDFVKAKMSDLHLLRGGIKFLKEIPRTSNGKVSRRAVRELFLSSN